MEDQLELTLYGSDLSRTTLLVLIACEHISANCFPKLKLNFVPLDFEANEHKKQLFIDSNPTGAVPLLGVKNGYEPLRYFTQSRAIIAFLNSFYGSKWENFVVKPEFMGLPHYERYKAEEIMGLLQDFHGKTNHWVRSTAGNYQDLFKLQFEVTFKAIEPVIAAILDKHRVDGFKYIGGHRPSHVDAFLVINIWTGVERQKLSIEKYPAISQVYNNCMELDPFKKIHKRFDAALNQANRSNAGALANQWGTRRDQGVSPNSMQVKYNNHT